MCSGIGSPGLTMGGSFVGGGVGCSVDGACLVEVEYPPRPVGGLGYPPGGCGVWCALSSRRWEGVLLRWFSASVVVLLAADGMGVPS